MSISKYRVIETSAVRLGCLTLAFLFCFQASSAVAQTRCWTTAGSAGTVDEASLGFVELNPYKALTGPVAPLIIDSSVATVKYTVTNGTFLIYYNVVAVEGVFGGARKTKNLKVGYMDNGNESQVIIELKRKNISNGDVTVMATFDSHNPSFTASTSLQVKDISFNSDQPELDFEVNIYYIEAKLIKTGTSGRPAIHAIQICKSQNV